MKIVSLFSGCGGMDLGFIWSGSKIIWANDIDRDIIDFLHKSQKLWFGVK